MDRTKIMFTQPTSISKFYLLRSLVQAVFGVAILPVVKVRHRRRFHIRAVVVATDAVATISASVR